MSTFFQMHPKLLKILFQIRVHFSSNKNKKEQQQKQELYE